MIRQLGRPFVPFRRQQAPVARPDDDSDSKAAASSSSSSSQSITDCLPDGKRLFYDAIYLWDSKGGSGEESSKAKHAAQAAFDALVSWDHTKDGLGFFFSLRKPPLGASSQERKSFGACFAACMAKLMAHPLQRGVQEEFSVRMLPPPPR